MNLDRIVRPYRPKDDAKEDDPDKECGAFGLESDAAPVPRSFGSSASFVVSEAVPHRIQPMGRKQDLVSIFSMLTSADVRRKPSYTDCWMTDPSEVLTPIASYMTPCGSVMIGTSDDGNTEYRMTPREYAYPDALNSLVMDLIDEIREVHREKGGRTDRDSIMGLARSLLTDRTDELRILCGNESVDAVINDICSIVHRHSVGAGIFEVLLSDPHIEDIYIDAPCDENRIHVTMNGIGGLNSHLRCRTNLMADKREVDNLVNILKRDSGLRFCRSDPVLETDFKGFDARVTVMGYPMSPNGDAVAIRKRSERPWTLTRLISNGTVDPRTAGLLSYLVNSRATFLVCGPRGAGKSSLLAALLFEFGRNQRILTIEDTLELPGDLMRRLGYKVQTILIDERMQGTQSTRSDEALRASLRMGESAIVLGEVRGEEARTLYQSMRAGRAGSAILGTIHGDSADSVYKRVVFDLGISPEAFMATDIVVTMGTVRDRRSGNLIRRVEEVVSTGDSPGEFVDISEPETLFASPVIGRILRSSPGGKKGAAKEIRARAMMHAYLAELGAKDESYLGPEWILAANDIVTSMGPDSTAESAIADFKAKIGVAE